MGEGSTTPVYIGKYEDGNVAFEPLGKFEVVGHDITDKYPDSDIFPVKCSWDEPITIKVVLTKKDLRKFYKLFKFPKYLQTEFLFPKKKRRGTARRKRRIINFIHSNKYGVPLKRMSICKYVISKDELPAFSGPFEGEEDQDDFFIPEPSPIPPISREEYLQKSSFSAPWPGPFEGEED